MTEAGYPEIAGESWFVVVVPAGTPSEIIALLHRDIAKIMARPDMKERLATLGYEPLVNTPEQCAALLKSEKARWGQGHSRRGHQGAITCAPARCAMAVFSWRSDADVPSVRSA